MARIYLTGSGPTKGYITGSGIISNPARILLQEKDSKTGSYPTIARTGDPDFSGQYASTFDDSKTINFVGGNLVYPTSLPASSIWVSGGAATPNILQGLIAAGTSSKGIADSQVEFTPGENIRPFDESRIYIDNDAAFYQTGTDSSILTGFNQKLDSKTSIVIDVNPVSSTEIFFSTGSVPNATSGYAQGVNSGIAYFNFQAKKWEVIGNLSTGSNLDIINYDESIRRNGLLAFAPAGVLRNDASSIELPKYVGMPVNNFGFPFAARYDATGSQMYCMSASISQPFLVEKIVVEFSGSFGPEYIYNNGFGPCVKQFFLLNQFQDSLENSSELSFSVYFAEQLGPSITQGKISLAKSKTRDLIGVGEISLIPSASAVMSAPKVTQENYLRDLNIVLTNAAGAGGVDTPRYDSVTGSYRLEFTPRVYAKQSVLGGIPLSLSTNRSTFYDAGGSGASYASYKEVVGTFFGGRQLTDASSGHSFIRSVAGTRVSGSDSSSTVGQLYPAFSSNAIDVPLVNPEDLRRVSPYILLPQSKIVFGYANTPNFVPNGFQSVDVAKLTEGNVADARTVIAPGIGKITLFGSLLRNNLPVSPESNQPLTSDAIHEDLHYDNPVFDQFDVEPASTLTGSYVDLIITGSMLSTPIGSSTAAGVRKVQGSVAAGQAGTTGSLQRFVNLASESDVFYDSYPPSLSEIYKSTGVGLLATQSFGSNVFPIAFSTPDDVNVSSFSVDKDWWLRSAYEISAERFQAVRLLQGQLPSFTINGTPSGVNFAFPEKSIYLLSSSNLIPFNDFVRDSGNSAISDDAALRSIASLFGFGDQKYNTPSFINQGNAYGTGYRALIRGYKYGLGGLFGTYTNARFRRDRYGQFRDMLEQSPNAAYLVQNSVEYPIEIGFFSRPGNNGKGRLPTGASLTHSQNLSTYATSSLPYFDNDKPAAGSTASNGVERADNPDVTLQPVELSITLE